MLIAARKGATFAASGGHVSGCAMGREMQLAPEERNAAQGYRPRSLANCGSRKCRVQEIVSRECLSKRYATDECILLVSNKMDGRGRAHMDRKPHSHPFRGTRNFPRKSRTFGIVYLYTLIPVSGSTCRLLHRATPSTSLPTGNSDFARWIRRQGRPTQR